MGRLAAWDGALTEGAGFLVNGLIALALSLAIWDITHNLWGWLVMFLPGAALVIVGWVVLLRRR